MKEVKCDNCKAEFAIKRINTFRLGKGIEKSSFSCSECKHEYISAVTDKEIRKLQLEIRRLRMVIGKASGDKRLEMTKTIEEMSQLCKYKIENLKASITGSQV